MKKNKNNTHNTRKCRRNKRTKILQVCVEAHGTVVAHKRRREREHLSLFYIQIKRIVFIRC